MTDDIHAAVCPLCAGVTHTILTRTLRRGRGTVFHCADCDLGFLVPRETKSDGYYGSDYRDTVSHRADGGGTNPGELFETYRNYQASRLAAVTPHLKPGTSILEIGASAGQFLHHVTAARRCAIEPDSRCCSFMERMGIETDSEFLSASRFYNEKFDIVCAFQVLEHTDDPVAFLKDIRHVLNPGGVAFVEVPNLSDHLLSVWGMESYRNFYYHEDHIFYFSEKSLKLVAEKAGFTNAKISFVQDFNLLNTLNWCLGNGPQPDCHMGLKEISLIGINQEISSWLSKELSNLNDRYTKKIVAAKATSNLLLEVRNENV